MDRLNQTDDNPALGMDVKQIFESTCISEDAMRQFQNLLKFFKKNEFRYVWRDENELHEKVMDASKKFVNDVIKNFRSKHSEIAQQIEGSACDVFETFFTEKLGESDFGKDSLFEYSFQETKKEFSRRISKLKEKLEREEQKGPKTTSDCIEEMISQTELSDPIHIHHALLCCRVAYDCEDPEKSLEEMQEKHLLGELIVSHDNDEVPRYVMARCGDVLYVTFRDFTKSWLSTYSQPLTDDWRGHVSSIGFEQAKKIPLHYFVQEIYQYRRIIFSGHSTGGVIAALVATFLLEEFKQFNLSLGEDYLESNLRCITFGLTPLWDSSFKNYVETLPKCFFHIVNKDDIVPKLFGINSLKIQEQLVEVVNKLVEIPLILNQDLPNWHVLVSLFKKVTEFAKEAGLMDYTPVFDIFGTYYMLNTSISGGQKYTELTASQARTSLILHPTNLMNLWNAHLVNHRIERYQHDVKVCLLGEVAELQKFSPCNVKKLGDIAPKINKVQYEKIGNRVVAKIKGRRMWFVYEVSIGEDKNLSVENIKSTESEVQTRMPGNHVSHDDHVTVTVKTHFENSKYIPAERVDTETTNYGIVTRRQEQLSKHSPCAVIELACLSALLERRVDERQSTRFNAIKTFFTDAVSVENKFTSGLPDYDSLMTLLIDGRKELKKFNEEMGAKLKGNGEEGAPSNYNTEMLIVLNKLRTKFRTCSTHLGMFMEAQVQIPLKSQNKTYVKIAKQAKSFRLFILPFTYVKEFLKRLPGQKFVVDIASSVYAVYDRWTTDTRHFTNYDGKLEFLLESTKKSFTSNKKFVSYSLERQLVVECKNRHIFAQTSLEDILQQWERKFKDETLTLVPDDHRPLVARWIKWSLMINRLRESIAEQTAVGVIGLVNSGKSKFVRSIFGIETITGTTAAKRTTVPFIYNLEPEIKGMDVIDFPGVDDQDKTIPELAKSLLSLARIFVFIVDYRRAHTQATKDWLNVLEKENVPVLICLSFADKLYAELMGEEGLRDVKDLKIDIQTQLEDVKNQIGQPKIGRREFKYTVFAFDNTSKLNCEEGKDNLRQAGLSDELDVGRWIVKELKDNEQSDLSQRVFSFIEKKEKSTLNSNKSTRKRRKSTTKPSDSDQGNVPTKRKDVKDSLNPDC